MFIFRSLSKLTNSQKLTFHRLLETDQTTLQVLRNRENCSKKGLEKNESSKEKKKIVYSGVGVRWQKSSACHNLLLIPFSLLKGEPVYHSGQRTHGS